MAFSSSLAGTAVAPRQAGCRVARSARVAPRASAAASGMVPDMEKRNIMNLLLVGAASLPTAYLVYGGVSMIVPPGVVGAGGGQPAKDAAGNDVKESEWLSKHKAGDHSLVQGLKSDATYLVVNDKGSLEKFAINAVCTHLGCVVPWNSAENKFACPCHGSQYNPQGKVVRGPAPLSLALAHADVNDDGVVVLSDWKEEDFRTGQKPWW